MRVKTGPNRHQRHKKIFAKAKGFRMSKHRLIRPAKDAVLHAGEYAFAGRKLRKRDLRSLWITRINGALSEFGITYNSFIFGLKKEKIILDRKILAELVSSDPSTFKKIAEQAK